MLTNDSSTKSVDVVAKQKKEGWQGTDYSKDNKEGNKIGGQYVDASTSGWTVKADNTNNTVTITANK